MKHADDQTPHTETTPHQQSKLTPWLVVAASALFSLLVFASLSTSDMLLASVLLGVGLLLSAGLGLYIKLLLQRMAELQTQAQQSSVQMVSLAEQAESRSVIDHSTGLFNRNYFDELVDNECRRAVREFSPLTMMLISVDYLKNFQESYGDEAAEQCLQRVAQTLKANVSRPGDLVARYDSEQFAFLLPSTNEQVVQLAERCCIAVRELAVEHNASPVDDTLTVSIGVATMQPSRLLTVERLTDTCTQALYQARKAGGDKYVATVEGNADIPSATYSL